MIELLNIDCMEYMAGLKDKAFDLAIVDPPYGINHANKAGKMAGQQYGNAAAKKKDYAPKDWDMSIPKPEYFFELSRVSKNQIIWGGNYFANLLPVKSGWLFWDKVNGDNNFSDGELAWTSFNKGLRMFKSTWNGMIQHDMKNKQERIHPTEKPIRLYKWLLQEFTKPGDKILDTHLGSGSSAIAAHSMGFDFVGCELDKDYYDAACKRFKEQTAQLKLI